MATAVLVSPDLCFDSADSPGVTRVLHGRVIELATPNIQHAEIQLQIGFCLKRACQDIQNSFIIGTQGGFIINDPALAPDVFVIDRERAEQGTSTAARCEAPELAVEIVSP